MIQSLPERTKSYIQLVPSYIFSCSTQKHVALWKQKIMLTITAHFTIYLHFYSLFDRVININVQKNNKNRNNIQM